VPKFFFHHYLDGVSIARDLTGLELRDTEEAIEQAVDQLPSLLAEQLAVRRSRIRSKVWRAGTSLAHISIEISDEREAVSLLRGKVILEHPQEAGRRAGGVTTS
jgi:hypothetical protein